MNRSAEQARRGAQGTTEGPPQRGSALTIFVVLAVVVLGLLIGKSVLSKRTPTAPVQVQTAVPPDLAAAPRATPDAVSHSARTSRPSVEANASGSQQLINQLTELKVEGGKLTEEQAAQIQQTLQQLVAQGPAAIPALREFLEKNQDWRLGKWPTGSSGAPTVRTGLLDALSQIGGPEATALSQQVLQTTADPLEIALVARNLEQAAPGQYAQQAVEAATAVLEQAAQGALTNVDVGPLFQVLQIYGSAGAAGELEKLASRWGYYATLALAQLPSDQGVAGLQRMAIDSSATGIGNRDFALQMLAQVSPRSADAATALVDLARQNQISDSAWRSLADVLSGMQYQFGRQFPNNMFTPVDGTELRTYTQQNGNQTFVSTYGPKENGINDVAPRLALIDQLIAANPGPTALQYLQQARGRLR